MYENEKRKKKPSERNMKVNERARIHWETQMSEENEMKIETDEESTGKNTVNIYNSVRMMLFAGEIYSI